MLLLKQRNASEVSYYWQAFITRRFRDAIYSEYTEASPSCCFVWGEGSLCRVAAVCHCAQKTGKLRMLIRGKRACSRWSRLLTGGAKDRENPEVCIPAAHHYARDPESGERVEGHHTLQSFFIF
ncbi:unnamed protein product [Ixodes pacificus]